ncbi:MAG: wax ester/triacylglycerol synthase family O-acyltransferase [Myxococcota bacterium]
MAEPRFDDRMSDSDALMWTIERDPLLRSTIVSVLVLDRPPDPKRLAEKLSDAARTIPRLRQRVVEDPLGVAPPRWAEDPSFDLSYHLRSVGVPGHGSLRDLLDLAAPLAMQAFDRDRPLWELTLVEGLENGGAAVIMKLHHAMSDGVGLVRMTAGLVERTREPEPHHEALPTTADPVPTPWSPIDESLEALRYQASRRIEQGRSAASSLASGLGKLLRHPQETLQDAAELASSAGRLLAPASEPLSPLMVERSLARRLDGFARPLDAFKKAAATAGGTVNDAFVAGMAGGLSRYHRLHGHRVESLRMSMPINLRHGEKGRRAGNQFAPVRFGVPMTLDDPRERITAIHERVAAERKEPSLPALDVLAGALNRLPGAASTAAFGSMLKTVDFITTNVPGPPFPVHLSGARITAMIPFGPTSGAAANIALFSYDGAAWIGVNGDRAAIPDSERFTECLEAGLDEVLALA